MDAVSKNICLHYLIPSIPDSQLFASRTFDEKHLTERARLDSIENRSVGPYLISGWVASSYADDPNAYIEAMFTDVKVVRGIVTKGRKNLIDNQYVKSYKISYSLNMQCQNPMEYVMSNGNVRIFQGNHDKDTASVQYLSAPIRAKCVRLYPIEYNQHRSLRFDILGCSEKCTTDMVTGLYGVSDNRITDSVNNATVPASQARLDTPDEPSRFGGWLVEDIGQNVERHYIQVRFRSIRNITSVITQGVNTSLHTTINNVYTKTYSVAYSRDCVTFNIIKDDDTNSTKIFPANKDWHSKVENILPSSITALCVRIIPESYESRKGLRFELKGCFDTTCPESPERVISPNALVDFQLRIFSKRQPYLTAMSTCETFQGSLVDMDDQEVRQYVASILQSCSVYDVDISYWINTDVFSAYNERCASISELDGALNIHNSTCGSLNGFICQFLKI